jgi:hypothetical protein
MEDTPSSQAFRSDLIETETRQPASNTRKNGNGKKNTGRAVRSNAREQEQEKKVQNAAVPFHAAEETPVDVPPAAAEKRIKELEKQLSDAEKELDVISKILAESNAAETGQGAITPASSAVSVSETAKKWPEPVKTAGSVADPKSETGMPGRAAASQTVHEYRRAKGSGLRFRLKMVTAVPLVAGIALYLGAFALSAQLGYIEEYFLLIAGTLLVSLGLYSSFEPVETQGMGTAA